MLKKSKNYVQHEMHKQSKTQNDVYVVNVYGADIAVNSHYEPIMLIGTIDCSNDFVDLKF